jgi:hypothetical protein
MLKTLPHPALLAFPHSQTALMSMSEMSVTIIRGFLKPEEGFVFLT